MKIVKCRQCGFTNSEFAEICQKCKITLCNTLEYLRNPATRHIRKKISYIQIIKSNYLMFIAVCFPVVIWLLLFGVMIFGFPEKDGKALTKSEANHTYMVIAGCAILLTGISIFYSLKRMKTIRRIISTGEFVIGVVNFIDFDADRGRVEYSYKYMNQIFQSGSAIMKNSKTIDFHIGDEIILVVDKQNPRKTLIPDLYV